MKKITLSGITLLVFLFHPIEAQPVPGDYFREYIWTTPFKEGNSSFLRVGGRFDYRIQPENYPDLNLKGEKIPLNFDVLVKDAIKSEVTIEKVLCHDGTKKLRISFNGSQALVFPESHYIPEPQEMYMHHFYPTVEIPLNFLKSGYNNFFSLEVDTIHPWNWPQNLIYGVIVRNYFPPPISIIKNTINSYWSTV